MRKVTLLDQPQQSVNSAMTSVAMDTNSAKSVAVDDARAVLLEVTGLERRVADVGQRRLEYVQFIARQAQGEAGFWGWGRGRPLDSSIAPVAAIPFGFQKDEWARVASAALADEIEQKLNRPIYRLLKHSGQVTVARSSVWNDADWYASHTFLGKMKPLGWDHTAICVRYCSADTWTHLTLFRKVGAPDFSPRDLTLIDLAISGVVWMHPQVSESVPPESFEGLTDRQRTVMLFVLDGISRKEIAVRLGLSLHTVNDHLKALYERFGVNSATELAARFLRSQ